MVDASKLWYHIVGHGIGKASEHGQPYESEIINVNNELVVYDNIDDIRSFIDAINILMSTKSRILGKTLPFVILEVQSTTSSMLTQAKPEEWYIYSVPNKMYLNTRAKNASEAILAYNSENKGYL